MSISWNWPGSRWWRIDLHAHTPASYDFGKGNDRIHPDWEKWILAVRAADLDASAITDHNTAAGISKLQQAAENLENAPILFPGIELTAGDGTHLLVLMDPTCTQQHVEEFLAQVSIPVDKQGDKTARSPLSVEQILDKCGDDTLIIGAHVNGEAGLLQEHEGQQRIAVLQHQNLAAVEIDPDKEIDGSWLDGSKGGVKRIISQVYSSDGHKFDDLGRRFTWVKMTRPNIEGLRLALLDGADSLKPTVQKNPGNNPNDHALLAIESITVDKGKFIGRKSPIEVNFNPWLNAIIGGRGTGKSTLIDFCRQTLHREVELDTSDFRKEGSLRDIFDCRMRVPSSRTEEGLLTNETCIEVVYRKAGERFLLSWSPNGSASSIFRLDGNEKTEEGGNIQERFPVRIYNQKQLFGLAQNPNALISVIDDSQSVRGAELNRVIKQLREQYLSLCAQARAVSTQASELPDRQALLKDVQRKLDILEESEQAQVLNKYRKQLDRDKIWQEIIDETLQSVEAVRHSAEGLSVVFCDLDTDSEETSADANLRRAHTALKQLVEEIQKNVLKSVDQARKGIDEIVQEGMDTKQWREAIDASTYEFEKASARLAKEGISDPNEYGDLLEQAAKLDIEIDALEKKKDCAEELYRKANDILEEYREKRDELSNKRQCFVKDTSSESIRIKIDKYGNRKHLAEQLIDILGIDHFDRDRQGISQRIQLGGKQWNSDNLDGVVAELRQFISGKIKSWQAKDLRFERALKRVPPERIDRLALYLPEDTVEVIFKELSNSGWKSIAQGSPGQQTAALLAFVLGYGSEPIILDQPEDDLDNRLIYELLVRRLRETKSKRQVIVVTHNPNIVVHGDAELVLSLEAQNGQSSIVCQGGLQERGVRDEICRVMEGGREAFEKRYQRIIPLG